MNVTEACSALRKFLTDNSDGSYYVVGYAKQAKNAESQFGKKMIQVFHAGGSFNKGRSAINGNQFYNATIMVRFTVSEPAAVDTDILDDPGSTNEERRIAIGQTADAEQRADESMDELFSTVFRLVMGGEGLDFGTGNDLNPIQIQDRFGEDFRKELPQKKGSLVVMNAHYAITCTTNENPNTETPIGGTISTHATDFQNGIDTIITQTGA